MIKLDIWFYLFLIVLFLLFVLTVKVWVMKKEIDNIGKSLSWIIKTDTNNLITISTNDKNLRKLVRILNKSLKDLRDLELEYKNGNQDLKSSITNISHDLRTPLTAIRGYLDLMDRQNLEQKQMDYLKIIDSKVRELIELTEQLFDFSKSLDMMAEVKKEMIAINDVLEEAILSFYSLFKLHDIKPKIDICEERVERLLNENMLRRVLENVISNAIKYGEEDLRIELTSEGKIIFSNKTMALDVISLANIFERYYTVRNAKKSSGIGLAIAKQLVESMDGTIVANYKDGYLSVEISF